MRIAPLFLFFFLVLFPKDSFTCDCLPAKPLDKGDISRTYPVVFFGKVLGTVIHNDKKFIQFQVNEPYIGKLQHNIEILDDESDCAPSFDAGQEWLVYATYWEYGKAGTSICTPTRRKFANEKDDYNKITRNSSFEEDKGFLAKNFGIQPFLIKNPDEEALKNRELEKPGGYGMVWMILIGTFVLALFYYLFNKLF
jgi:hypothetical protein